MKRILAVVLLAAMLLTLTACGDDERLGKYDCKSIISPAGAVEPNGEWLELKSAKEGTIRLTLDLGFTWETDKSGEHITITTKALGDVYTGTMTEDMITLTVGENTMVFVKQGSSVVNIPTAPAATTVPTEETVDPAATEPAETKPVTEPVPETEPTTVPPTTAPADSLTTYQKFWNGSYYGYWAAYEGEETTTSDWWDCCADITIDENNNGVLRIWDEDFNDRDDGVANVELFVIDPNEDGYGIAASVGGWFLNGELDDADMILDAWDPDFPGGIVIDMSYTEEETEYSIQIYLRPWGLTWDDVADTKIGLPYYYENWYLPAIEAGARMPEHVLDDWDDSLEPQPLSPDIQGVMPEHLSSSFIPEESEDEVLLPTETLKAIYAAMTEDWLDVYYMDYSDIITKYLSGLEGRVGYVSEEGTYFSMYWLASDAEEYSVLEIDFTLNEEGIWMYAGKGGSNAIIDE